MGNKSTNLGEWNEAISDAKERIKALKRSIRTFEELRDSGMAWPGTAASEQADKAGDVVIGTVKSLPRSTKVFKGPILRPSERKK